MENHFFDTDIKKSFIKQFVLFIKYYFKQKFSIKKNFYNLKIINKQNIFLFTINIVLLVILALNLENN